MNKKQSLHLVEDQRKVWDEQAAALLDISPDMLPMELCTVACSRCPHKVQTLLPLSLITRQAMEKIGWALIDLQPVCSQHLPDSEVC